MATINIIKNSKPFRAINIDEILSLLSPSDIPYYIDIEETESIYVVKLFYIFDKEEKIIISLGNAQMSIGNISGKIYQYKSRTIQNSLEIVNPLKFKDKIKDIMNYKNDSRFKNNIISFIKLLDKVIS